MRKIIIFMIVCACLGLSGCVIPRHVRKAFSYCYTDTYTGIDTLININGFYSSLIFYDNGLVVYPTGSSFIERFKINKDTLYLREIANLETEASKLFYDSDCGSYIICGDTIKVQIINNCRFSDTYMCGMEE